MNNDLYTPKKKVMPEMPGMRLIQRDYCETGLLDGSFVNKLYISVVEQIDDAIVAECVKIAHEAGIGQHIVLNKKFIVDAIREKLESQQVIDPAKLNIRDVVWLEEKRISKPNRVFPAKIVYVGRDDARPFIEIGYFGNDDWDNLYLDEYNRSWRCWKNKPSNEVCNAAEWEGKR